MDLDNNLHHFSNSQLMAAKLPRITSRVVGDSIQMQRVIPMSIHKCKA